MKVDKKFVVYMVSNIINGAKYIGYTSNFKRRRIAHVGRVRRNEDGCPKFHNAIRKYGTDAFVWQILATFDTSAAALKEEVRLIKKIKPEYNLSLGGEGNSGLPAWNRRPVTCLEDGNVFHSCTHAAEFYGIKTVNVYEVCAEKYRSAQSRYHFIFGKIVYKKKYRLKLIREIEAKHAKRRKQKRRISRSYRGVIKGTDVLGRSAAGPIKNSRKVMCVEDGRIFPSINAAARHYDVNASAITQLCKGSVFKVGNTLTKRFSVGGLKFKYASSRTIH